MADKTYKLNISKSDGSFSDSVRFTIPQKEGTYKVEFELSNGNKVNAGNIIVSNVEKTYKTEFQLSNGSTIDGGTFTTPVVRSWKTVWTGNERVVNISYKGESTGTKEVILTNDTLSGVDWSRPTKITGVAVATAGVKTETKEISALELIDNNSEYLVGISVKDTSGGVTSIKAQAEMRITRNASNSNAIVSASCERNVSNAGIFFLRLNLTKVEQYY